MKSQTLEVLGKELLLKKGKEKSLLRNFHNYVCILYNILCHLRYKFNLAKVSKIFKEKFNHTSSRIIVATSRINKCEKCNGLSFINMDKKEHLSGEI